jgi:hypothetical protein
VPGRRRRRGRRRCRDAPVGAPPEGNAKEVIRRRRRVTMAASSDDSVVSHSSSPAASRVSPSSVVCSTTPLAQTFPQLAQHVVERGALTHSHDSERSSLCSQRGSLRARARSSLRSASLRFALLPVSLCFLREKGSVESTHKVPTSHYNTKHRTDALITAISLCFFARLPRFRSAKIALPAPVFALPPSRAMTQIAVLSSRATTQFALPPSRATTHFAVLGGRAFRWDGVLRWVGVWDLPIPPGSIGQRAPECKASSASVDMCGFTNENHARRQSPSVTKIYPPVKHAWAGNPQADCPHFSCSAGAGDAAAHRHVV